MSAPSRVVIAPDSFSGTMSAAEASEAIARGWAGVRPDDDLVCTPMSDGGLGLLDVVARAQPDAIRNVAEVADARGIACDAAWLRLPDGTAIVETAQAISLHALEPDHRDPARTTTYGIGQLLMAVAIDPKVTRVVVGLGGSATVDGGVGMISALSGHAVRRADGNGVKVGGRWVADTAAVGAVTNPLGDRPLIVAADVDNPLLGTEGAARVFGPQKGAGPALVEELEAALTTWADVVEATRDGRWRDTAGAGAAGGLGFALMALLDAEVVPGAAVVADLVGVDARGAAVVITGEGRLDHQTGHGKAPWEVAARAREAGAVLAAIVGEVAEPAAAEAFDAVEPLGPDGLDDPTGAAVRAAAALAIRLRGRG